MCQASQRWHAVPVALCALGLVVSCAGDRRPAIDRGTAPDPGDRVARAGDAGSLEEAPNGPLALIPRPRSTTMCTGSFVLDAATTIVTDDDPDVRAVGARLAQWLDVPASSVRAIPAVAPGPAPAIVIRLEGAGSQGSPGHRDPSVEPPRDVDDEAYTLDVSPALAVLRARHPAGLFYGAQTLAQLAASRPLLAAPLPVVASATPASPTARATRVLPCVRIEDGPVHRVRAMHLDVARHFFTKEVVERYVDILAFYRFNVFHWHLTDDQGFRLAVRSHPELTQVGGKRLEDGHEHAGSYSQDDAREVIAFAKDRFVTVVPEIEMPGHARAILASHPELSCTGKKQDVPSTWGVFEDVLCAGNEKTFALIADILGETCDVFPSRLVHVGGDEVPKKRWKECPRCRARMKKEHLDPEQLQGAFMKRAGELLAARGRRMLAWDEALDGGLAKDGVVLAWQSVDRGRVAALADHDVVMVPYDTTYFNFHQSRSGTEPGHDGYLPWTKVLAFDPQPGGLDARQSTHVLGGEGTLWTEYVRTADDLETLLLPRLAALSETLWRMLPADRAGVAEQASFVSRFMVQRRMLDASGVRYFVEPPTGLRARSVLVDEASMTLAAPSLHPDGVVRFTLDGSDPDAHSTLYGQPIALHAATSVAARLFLPGGRSSGVVRGRFEREALRPSLQPSLDPAALHEGASYKYFEGDFHRLPDFARLVPRRTGRVPHLSLDASFRPERFAVRYDAWVLVPADGVYRFVTHADDGVTLDIDGVRLITDDGEHAARDADGEIALQHGLHRVQVGYFQGIGGKDLGLTCEGPSLPLGACVLVSP